MNTLDKIERIYKDNENEYVSLACVELLNKSVSFCSIVPSCVLEDLVTYHPERISIDKESYNPNYLYHLLFAYKNAYAFIKSLSHKDCKILLYLCRKEVFFKFKDLDIDLVLPTLYKLTAVKLFYKRSRKKVSITINNNLYEIVPSKIIKGEFTFYINKKEFCLLADNANELITPLYKYINTSKRK